MKIVSIFILLFSIQSCDYFQPKDEVDAVARVNETYLYKSDLKGLVPFESSQEDSLSIVTTFINKWASNQLLLQGAEVNLPERNRIEFDKLVNQYRTDLLTNAYLDALVQKNIKDEVTEEEMLQVYENNSESFKINEELIQFRFVQLALNATNVKEVEKRFKSFKEDDRTYLDSISLQFKSFTLNDSSWVKYNQVKNKISVITEQNQKELLKKSNFLQLKDSIDLYLIKINDVLFANSQAPLQYVKPTIEQIVINKRKLELIRQLEKDITKDAIKNNQFEIYN
ncbi:MAG: peptidylprolyl isomerase [Bacteroidetes bacterium MedPE-SWsnd-G2]|nr:MAG: peptidylprolyl isomerase [Bacteroidetes bacterium MedPE-SWsnd-G2]